MWSYNADKSNMSEGVFIKLENNSAAHVTGMYAGKNCSFIHSDTKFFAVDANYVVQNMLTNKLK